ncbi:hypothetical protein B0E51_11365 [Rhodanobacter sp. C05]|nr:hypothetical protein B0E51_11365 [Rhodanobacter sp. C05]
MMALLNPVSGQVTCGEETRQGDLPENGKTKRCYLMSCYRYVELNPARAGMITPRQDYLNLDPIPSCAKPPIAN